MLYAYGVDKEELELLEKWLRSQLSKEQNKSINLFFTQVPSEETNSMALDIGYQLKDGDDVSIMERLFLIPIYGDTIGITTKAPRLVRSYIRMDVRQNNVIWICKNESNNVVDSFYKTLETIADNFKPSECVEDMIHTAIPSKPINPNKVVKNEEV